MKEFDEDRCVDAVDDADDADDVIGADDDGDHVTCVTSLPAGGASAGHVLGPLHESYIRYECQKPYVRHSCDQS